MCGIAGYIGENEALPFLLEGLKRLEYRGYDSAGVAVCDGHDITVRRKVGKIAALEAEIAGETIGGSIGMGHTRWATHGVPSDRNAHPHRNGEGDFVVVHNGIIENYLDLKASLKKQGYTFESETDTEVLPNLVASCYQGDLLQAVFAAKKKLRGSYAAVFLCKEEPDRLIAVRKDSPLILGIGADGFYLASDIPALIGHADKTIVLNNDEVVVLTRARYQLYSGNKPITRPAKPLDMDEAAAQKGGFEHFMLKEIMEQPRALRDCLSGRITDGEHIVDLGKLKLNKKKMAQIDKIMMVACGTAYHACLVGKTLFERILRIPVEVDIASEFRYRDPIVDGKTMTIVVSQSGETADTLAALAEAKSRGSYVLGITNVWESSVYRESDDVIHTRAGLEIAVASTKAYSTQLLAIYLLGLYMAELRGTMERDEIKAIADELYLLPQKAEKLLSKTKLGEIKQIGEDIAGSKNAFFIGRGLDHGVALEGALKLKEISYIHAEAYAAGELKHGTLALIEDQVPVVCLCTQGAVAEKMLSNIEEVKARKARIITFAFSGNRKAGKKADAICYLPKTLDILAPILAVIPLQLISYYAAVKLGCDVDQPRNLAKSVTVE